MEDRGFTEVQLRNMLERAGGCRASHSSGRWVIYARHRRRTWKVIVEPDLEAGILVVITAYELPK